MQLSNCYNEMINLSLNFQGTYYREPVITINIAVQIVNLSFCMSSLRAKDERGTILFYFFIEQLFHGWNISFNLAFL